MRTGNICLHIKTTLCLKLGFKLVQKRLKSLKLIFFFATCYAPPPQYLPESCIDATLCPSTSLLFPLPQAWLRAVVTIGSQEENIFKSSKAIGYARLKIIIHQFCHLLCPPPPNYPSPVSIQQLCPSASLHSPLSQAWLWAVIAISSCCCQSNH